MSKKKLNAHELYEAVNDIGMDGVILTKDELIYKEYIDSKESINRDCGETYEDSYTRAWDYISENIHDDFERDCWNDWFEYIIDKR